MVGKTSLYIRITSDHGSISKANTPCIYLAAMPKGMTELDLRRGCSTGHRVLASIVIHLTLVETFYTYTDCRLMALDEPTSNLDHVNK